MKPAPWHAAVEVAGDGTRLLLDATPGARRARFPDGFEAWRGRIGVRVTAPARDGKANRDVVAAVAAGLGLAASQVRLEAGATDRRKSVWVPMARPAVLAALAQHMEGA